MVMGDFNTPLLNVEKFGGSQINWDSKSGLSDFININALIDLDLQGASYTWTNRRIGHDLIQVRLDRALISGQWFIDYFCALRALSRVGSDHFPICLIADPTKVKKNSPFRFKFFWLSHPRIFEEIKRWWNIDISRTSMFRIAKKLKEVKFNLRRWKKDAFGNIFGTKSDIQGKLQEI